jgi:hypothetical protein
MASIINANTSGGLISTGDTSGQLQLQTGGTTALTVTSAQQVGIGTSSPNRLLSLYATQPVFQITNVASGNSQGTIQYQSSGSTDFILDNQGSGSGGNILFQQAGTLRMQLDTSGNLGLGVTPKTWSSSFKPAFQFGTTGSLLNGSGYTMLSNNWYQDATGTDKYITSNYATNYYQNAGTHVWRTAPSGTAGNTVTFTESMILNSSGTLVINPSGTNNPPFPALWVYGGGSGTQGSIRIGDSIYPSSGNYWNIGRDNSVTGNFTFSYNGTQNSYIQANTGTYVAVSDSRVKKNIVNSNYGLAEVLRLRPVMYNMILEEENVKQHIGLIAQEVKAVIDEAVDDLIDESQQFYGLDKSGLVPVLVKAIQELSTQLTELKAEVATLKGA